MSGITRKLFPFIDDILFLLTGEHIDAETVTQTILAFITLMVSIINAKLKIIPDTLLVVATAIFVTLYSTIFNIATKVLRVSSDVAHDYSFFMSIILSILLIHSYIPTLIPEASTSAAVLLSLILLVLSFIYQVLFNIIIKVAIIEIEKNNTRYLYPIVLLLLTFLAYGVLIGIFKLFTKISAYIITII